MTRRSPNVYVILLLSMLCISMACGGPSTIDEYDCASLLDKVYDEGVQYTLDEQLLRLPTKGTLSGTTEVSRNISRLRCTATSSIPSENYFYQVEENSSGIFVFDWGTESYSESGGINNKDCHTLVGKVVDWNHENGDEVQISRIFDVKEAGRTATTYDCQGTAKLTERFLGSQYRDIRYFFELDSSEKGKYWVGYEFE